MKALTILLAITIFLFSCESQSGKKEYPTHVGVNIYDGKIMNIRIPSNLSDQTKVGDTLVFYYSEKNHLSLYFYGKYGKNYILPKNSALIVRLK